MVFRRIPGPPGGLSGAGENTGQLMTARGHARFGIG
jgi:hypothetical protein